MVKEKLERLKKIIIDQEEMMEEVERKIKRNNGRLDRHKLGRGKRNGTGNNKIGKKWSRDQSREKHKENYETGNIQVKQEDTNNKDWKL